MAAQGRIKNVYQLADRITVHSSNTNYWVCFKNNGKVLTYEPIKLLSSNYLSSFSRLPATSENDSIVKLILKPHKN